MTDEMLGSINRRVGALEGRFAAQSDMADYYLRLQTIESDLQLVMEKLEMVGGDEGEDKTKKMNEVLDRNVEYCKRWAERLEKAADDGEDSEQCSPMDLGCATCGYVAIQVQKVKKLEADIKDKEVTICRLSDIIDGGVKENDKLRRENKDVMEKLEMVGGDEGEASMAEVYWESKAKTLEAENDKLRCENKEWAKWWQSPPERKI